MMSQPIRLWLFGPAMALGLIAGCGDSYPGVDSSHTEAKVKGIILIKGMTPIPYKLVTIASGAAAFSFPVFVVASIVTRGLRFFLVAALLKYYGPPIRDFIERRLTLVTTIFVVGLVGGFVVIRYLI